MQRETSQLPYNEAVLYGSEPISALSRAFVFKIPRIYPFQEPEIITLMCKWT